MNRQQSATMKDGIKQFVPGSFWAMFRGVYCPLADALDLLLRRSDGLTPPRRLIFPGARNFRNIGEEFLGHFIVLGELKPNERVLDIGCGAGRMAVPLTKYLSSEGSYVGIDVVSGGITWCTKNIAKKYPNFRFYLASIHNKRYITQKERFTRRSTDSRSTTNPLTSCS